MMFPCLTINPHVYRSKICFIFIENKKEIQHKILLDWKKRENRILTLQEEEGFGDGFVKWNCLGLFGVDT